MTALHSDYTDVKKYDTFPKLLAYNAESWPDEVALREKEFGIWNAFSWADYNRHVKLFALGMHQLGIGHKDTVGIIVGKVITPGTQVLVERSRSV